MPKDPRFQQSFTNSSISTAATDRTDNQIVGKEIANGSILTDHLANSIITTAKITDGAITTSKITDSSITDIKMTTAVQQRLANNFIKKQIVNRRPIIVDPVGPASNYGLSLYGPFSYNVPAVQSGAERRHRIYAVYSDNVTANVGSGGGYSLIVSFDLWDSSYNGGVYGAGSGPTIGDYSFYLPYTWGDSATYRDALSNEIVGIFTGSHATVNIGPYNDGSGRTIKILYMEIQTLDVFP